MKPLPAGPGTLNKNKVAKLLFIEQLGKPFCALKITNANICGHAFEMITIRLTSHNAIQFLAAEAACNRQRAPEPLTDWLENLCTQDFQILYRIGRRSVIDVHFAGRLAGCHFLETEMFA